jgi:hypothetical protein
METRERMIRYLPGCQRCFAEDEVLSSPPLPLLCCGYCTIRTIGSTSQHVLIHSNSGVVDYFN